MPYKDILRRRRQQAIYEASPAGKATGRRAYLKRRYKLTPEEFDALLGKQGGHCALCHRTAKDEKKGRLNVDHCHKTGRIRGLLCTPHNRAIGNLGDDEEGLARALAYVHGR